MWAGCKTSTYMHYYKRLKLYKASNVRFDPNEMIATSYGWWVFLRKIRGKIVFNNYNYSISTSGHQRKVLAVLRDLKIKVDIFVNSHADLYHLDAALTEKYKSIAANEVTIAGKARPKTKKRCLAAIKSLKKDVKNLRSIGAKVSRDEIKEIQADAVKTEIERLERNRKERQSALTGKSLTSNDSFAKTAQQFELVV